MGLSLEEYAAQQVQQGIEQTKEETAKLMKEKGLDSSLIKEITGIDVNNN